MVTTVLIVDDDPAFRALARRLLCAAGMTVVGEAGTVADAIAAAEELRPDAALVDVDLPDGSGPTLARQLTALPWQPRVLLTSVDAEAVPPDVVRRSGARGFVPKDHLPNGALRDLRAGD